MPPKFKMSNKGVGELLNSPGVIAELQRRAKVIRNTAEALSPVGAVGDPHPGFYKQSWYSRVEIKGVGQARKKRPVGVVGSLAPYARWVEYGSERVRAHHVLLRAATTGGG